MNGAAKGFRIPAKERAKEPRSQKRFCSRDCLNAWRKESIVREPTFHRRITDEGYVEINVGPPRGRVKEHILVMERHLGRELVPVRTSTTRTASAPTTA